MKTEIILSMDFVDKRTNSSFLKYEGELWKIVGIVPPNKYLLRIVSRETFSEEIKVVNRCPECGGELIPEGGCSYCPDCGYSPCK